MFELYGQISRLNIYKNPWMVYWYSLRIFPDHNGPQPQHGTPQQPKIRVHDLPAFCWLRISSRWYRSSLQQWRECGWGLRKADPGAVGPSSYLWVKQIPSALEHLFHKKKKKKKKKKNNNNNNNNNNRFHPPDFLGYYFFITLDQIYITIWGKIASSYFLKPTLFQHTWHTWQRFGSVENLAA